MLWFGSCLMDFLGVFFIVLPSGADTTGCCLTVLLIHVPTKFSVVACSWSCDVSQTLAARYDLDIVPHHDWSNCTLTSVANVGCVASL